MKARTAAWLLVPVPLVAGGVTALGFVAAGDERMLQLGATLPAVAVTCGALLSCAFAVTLALGSVREKVTALTEIPQFCSSKFPTLGRSAA